MPVIMKENVKYAYTDPGIKAHTLSYAEYQALSTEEKMNGDLYFIPDKQPEGNPSLIWDKLGTATLDTDADNVSDAINEHEGDISQLNSSKANKITYQRYTVNFGACTNNTDYDKTLNISRDGYAILGIVDFNILGSYGTHFHISRMSIDNFTTLHIKIRANSTTAFTTDSTRVDVLILYVAN